MVYIIDMEQEIIVPSSYYLLSVKTPVSIWKLTNILYTGKEVQENI